MFRFLIFLILIILMQRFIKTLQEQQQKEQQKKQQQEPTEDEVRNYFQILGFPLPEEIPIEPKPERQKEPVITKKEIKKTEVGVSEDKPEKPEPKLKQKEVKKEEVFILSADKLEEGILLSEILAPPKAHQLCRGGGIGIRAGLKNR